MTQIMKSDFRQIDIIQMAEQKLMLEEFLIKKSDLKVRDMFGNNALYWAIKNKNFKNVKLLLKYGITLEVKERVHALFHAIEHNNYDSFKYILEKNMTNINMTNYEGQTLLMKAIEFESLNITRYLINSGADLYEMDLKYDMALDYATRSDNTNIFNLLHYKVLYNEIKGKDNECHTCAISCLSKES